MGWVVQVTGGLVSHPAVPEKAYFQALPARQELQGCKPTELYCCCYCYYYFCSGIAGLLGLVSPNEDSKTTLGPWPAPRASRTVFFPLILYITVSLWPTPHQPRGQVCA